MATVLELVDRFKAEVAVSPLASAPARLTNSQLFLWIHDAYKRIATVARIPQATASQNSVADQADYTIPTDCHKGIDGIISVEYDGKPLIRRSLKELQDQYGEDWKAPPGINGVEYYTQYDDSTKVYLVNKPSSAVINGIKIVYVDALAVPTSTGDTIPFVLEQYLDIIPRYMLGRALQLDKDGRAGSYLAEFEGRLLRERNESRRGFGRRTGAQAYTLGFDTYRRGYGRR